MNLMFHFADVLLFSERCEAVQNSCSEGDGISKQGRDGETQAYREQGHPENQPTGDTTISQPRSYVHAGEKRNMFAKVQRLMRC